MDKNNNNYQSIDLNNNNNNGVNCVTKLNPIHQYVSTKLWSKSKQSKPLPVTINNNNNQKPNMKLGDQQQFNHNYNHNHYQRYRSGSSSDSAITLDSPTIEDEFKQVQQNHQQSTGTINESKLNSSDLSDDFNQLAYHLITMALDDDTFFHSDKFNQMLPLIKVHCDFNCKQFESKLSLAGVNCDSFGFIKDQSKLSNCDNNNDEQIKDQLKELIVNINNERASKLWTIGCDNLKQLIRDYGIPNQLRPQVWMAFIKAKLGQQYDIDNLLGLANEVSPTQSNQDSIIKQIDLDVTRTMPSNVMFSTTIGLAKLRRILIAYCIHVNPFVGYCQAMNFIAALLLLIFQGNEAQSLMGLICIIDHYFPPNYFDEQLTGARSDQLLLRDLFLERLSSDKDKAFFNGSLFVQITNSLSLNWFLSLFHNAVPWQIRLQILDCFWIEGVKVLFRFSIALIELGCEGLTSSSSSSSSSSLLSSCYHLNELASGEIINSIKEKSRRCYDINRLKRLAFRSIKIPKRKHLAARRSFYVKQIVNGLDDIIIINSITSSTNNHSHNHQETNRQLRNLSSSTSPAPSSSPDDEVNHLNQSNNQGNIKGRLWLRRKSSGLLRGLSINQHNQSNQSEQQSNMQLTLSSDNSVVILIEQNGAKDELIVTTVKCPIVNPSNDQQLADNSNDDLDSSETKMIKKVVIKLLRKNRYHLYGVSNDSRKIYFYQETIKGTSVNCLYNNWINIVPISYRVKSAFHDSSKSISLFVGTEGIVTKINHNEEKNQSTDEQQQLTNGVNSKLETISLDQQSQQLQLTVPQSSSTRRSRGKCTIQSTNYDPISGQLAIYMVTPELGKLYIIDIYTLDIFNCLTIDCYLNHLSLSSSSSSSILFASTIIRDPMLTQLETINFYDILTTHSTTATIKQSLVQNTDLIVTIRSFLWSPQSVNHPCNHSDHHRNHLPDQCWYKSLSSFSLSSSSSSLSTVNCNQHKESDHHLLIVLFKNCRLLCVQIDCDHRITRKRSCTINDNFDCSKAIIVNVDSQLDTIYVTLFSPSSKLKTVSL